jgi:hypothetical protein
MATVITGRDVVLEIDNDDFEPQSLSVSLTVDDDQQVYETFAGPVYKTLTQSYTLEMEMLSDWGTTGSLCQALEAAFDTAPDTSLDFTMTITGPDDTVAFVGKVFPRVPAVTGTGAAGSTVSITLPGDVNTALTITPTPIP